MKVWGWVKNHSKYFIWGMLLCENHEKVQGIRLTLWHKRFWMSDEQTRSFVSGWLTWQQSTDYTREKRQGVNMEIIQQKEWRVWIIEGVMGIENSILRRFYTKKLKGKSNHLDRQAEELKTVKGLTGWVSISAVSLLHLKY